MKQPAVHLANVSKIFTGEHQADVPALEDISLDIPFQAFVSLIGPSGCGKSTLLRIIGDLVPSTTGTVLVKGKSARQARLDREYGMVFQAATLYEWRTVGRNVQLPLEVMGIDRRQQRAIVREVLATVDLADFEHHYPWQLSGGMQQRVSIARALAYKPDLLLMDEPFGALDEMSRERLNLELLRLYTETGTTVLFVTHSIMEAVFLSTHVVVMSARPGRITQIVPIDLPYPRTTAIRESMEFFQLTTRVREALHAGHS